jgi:hypothetical protein
MDPIDLKARVKRLGELARGLSKEVALWKAGLGPLLYAERKTYLKGIQDALAGVEVARVALAAVVRRLEAEKEMKNLGKGRNRRPGLD